MCSSRCLKDTCSRMALVWSLIGFFWNLMGIVVRIRGLVVGSGVLVCRCLRWTLVGSRGGLMNAHQCFLEYFLLDFVGILLVS